jgi:hypothetical protein
MNCPGADLTGAILQSAQGVPAHCPICGEFTSTDDKHACPADSSDAGALATWASASTTTLEMVGLIMGPACLRR